MGRYYHSITIPKKKGKIEIFSPGSLIISLTCLIVISSSGCATGRQSFPLSVPLPVAEQYGTHPECEAQGSEQTGSRLGRTASATCRILAVPFLVAGAGGLWYLERTGEEEDDAHDSRDIHQRRDLCLFSIGSFLLGSILYYASQRFDDTTSFLIAVPVSGRYSSAQGLACEDKSLNTSARQIPKQMFPSL